MRKCLPSMNLCTGSLKVLFLFYMILLQSVILVAEGTKQLEPTNPASTPNRRTRIMLDQTGGSSHRTPFATVNCAEKYRLNVYISDSSTEQIYFGFNDGENSLKYQIKDPDGLIVAGYALGTVPTSGAGFISTWNQAFAGPKIGTVNPTGYDPIVLTPLKTGNYYFEFANSSGSLTGQDMLYFDISVVNGTTVKNGRLWSKAWQLSDAASGDEVTSYPSKLYVYSDDGIVTQLNINEWNGGTYTVYCNQWGVTNTNNWSVDRMSDDTWPGSDLPQYKIFLNNPDVQIFPTGQLGEICEVSSRSYCNGTIDILAKVNKPGSLTLDLDIDPQGPGPEDVVLTGSVTGSLNCDVWDTITWNGLDGNGNPVQSGTHLTVDVDYLNGLTNLPLWDVEDNPSGLIVNIVRPAPTFSTKLPIYWDDSDLPGGSVNAVDGCIYPSSVTVSGCHHWTSQNENMINSWWYFSAGSSDLDVVMLRNPQADFTFANNCFGNATEFTDQTQVPGGYITNWHWDFALFGDTSNLQNPVFTFATPGNHSVHLRVTSDAGCVGNITKPVVIQPSPTAFAGEDKGIPYGTSTSLEGNATGGSGAYTYHWEPAALLIDPSVPAPSTNELFETTDFTFTVTDQGNGCPNADVVTVTVFGGPLGINLSASQMAVCPGSSSTINAQVGGGSGTYSYYWTSDPPGFSSTLEDITVQPEGTTTYTLTVFDGFSTLTKTITITVLGVPVANPGLPQTIPHGTTAQLNGSASTGYPPLSYQWSPEALVVNPLQGSTLTRILFNTTNFTLTVTDGNGCSSSGSVTVTISGGPLMVQPVPEQSPICRGASTRLLPLASGGSGSYSYLWTSDDGFSSTAMEPFVSPLNTTVYHLVVSDGFTQYAADVTVAVNPLPAVSLIPQGAHLYNTDTILACVFDTLTLSAQSPNCTYLWSNGATSPEILVGTTGIAFDMLSYSVDVYNPLTECSSSAAITIIFTYGECSYSIQEATVEHDILVYPNPGNGLYYVSIPSEWGDASLQVFDLPGRKLVQQEARGASLLQLYQLPAGIYLLRVNSGAYRGEVKLIKNQ